MELNIGHQSAKRQSWRAKNVRQLVMRLKSEHPKADEDRIIKLFRDIAREDDEYFEAAIDYAVHNALNALEEHDIPARRPMQRTTPQQRQQREEEVTAAVKAGVNQILFLNQEMPNGKRMRYCTGAEMSKFGKAFARIAKKVGPTKMVQSVLDEKQVRALMS